MERRIERLFAQFASFYGHVWRNQFKSEKFKMFAMREWQTGLKTFTDKVVEDAIETFRVSKSEFPPSLPQVVEQCRRSRARGAFYQSRGKTHRANPELAGSYLQQIFKTLKQ